jgi:protein phosphatase 2C family protein 2/3
MTWRSFFPSGIWDCLSSQDVIDFVRLKVSEGMELSQIGELMCEHCLAPDTSSGTGIGCDNMTVLIVALLHGKTKQEWYDWIKDRVKNGYGYATPDVIPQIYSEDRLSSYKARREAQQERDRMRRERGEESTLGSSFGGNSALSGFARILGSTGGISFHPGSGILNDSSGLMFNGNDEDDDEDSDDEMGPAGLLNGRSFFSEALGLRSDATANLQPRFEDDEFDDEDNKPFTSGGLRFEEIQDEAVIPFDQVNNGIPKSPSPSPSPTNSKVNGDVTPVQQFKSPPLGDGLNPTIKVDGLMDSSEDPWKA